MEIMLKGKTIKGIKIEKHDNEFEESADIDDIHSFFCTLLATVQVHGQAEIVIDNTHEIFTMEIKNKIKT